MGTCHCRHREQRPSDCPGRLVHPCLLQVRLSIEQERTGGKQCTAATDQKQPAAAAPQPPDTHLDDCGEGPSTSGSASDPVDDDGAVQQPAQHSTAVAAAAGAGAAVAGAARAGAAAEGALQQQQQQPAEVAGGSLDIRDLSWVDRERVLRLLFAKINGKAAERRAAALPPHPLDAAAQAAAARAAEHAVAACDSCC